jgi:hypothetical protein
MHNSCLAGPSPCDEYPDRDILCSANDVTRKEYLVDASPYLRKTLIVDLLRVMM